MVFVEAHEIAGDAARRRLLHAIGVVAALGSEPGFNALVIGGADAVGQRPVRILRSHHGGWARAQHLPERLAVEKDLVLVDAEEIADAAQGRQ